MKKSDVYLYPAIFSYADDGISVSFPDLPGCFSCGENDAEAFRMAKEALGGFLSIMEDNPEEFGEIPSPTPLNCISVANNERAVLIEVYMPLIRNAYESSAVKKTLTIPQWMDKAAKQENINFSQLLQSSILDALKHSSSQKHVQ